jgi:hypothetical protein
MKAIKLILIIAIAGLILSGCGEQIRMEVENENNFIKLCTEKGGIVIRSAWNSKITDCRGGK